MEDKNIDGPGSESFNTIGDDPTGLMLDALVFLAMAGAATLLYASLPVVAVGLAAAAATLLVLRLVSDDDNTSLVTQASTWFMMAGAATMSLSVMTTVPYAVTVGLGLFGWGAISAFTDSPLLLILLAGLLFLAYKYRDKIKELIN